MAYCSVVLALLRVSFFGSVITRDCDHGVISHILLQTVVSTSIVWSRPACTSSAGMLSTHGAFPFFKALTASSTSSLRNGSGSSRAVFGQLRTAWSPTIG